MTRAKVNSNIRYNENLIRSYQKSIQSLNTQIDELNALKRKIQGYQSEFSSRERNRRNRLSNQFTGKFNLRFVISYVTGMLQLFSGSEYRKAYNGLSEAIHRIDRQISCLRNEVNSYNSQIAYRRKRNDYWRRQLRYAT